MLGGIFRSLVNPTTLFQIAAGPAGWASLAMRTIGSQLAMNLIQRIGQQIGLPQSTIDLAQAAFAGASGQPNLVRQNMLQAVQGLTQQLDLRPSEAGQLQRDLLNATDTSMSNLMDIVDNFRRTRGGGQGEEEGGSWLVAMARALGQALDQKAAQIQEKSNEVAAFANQSVTKDKTGLSAKSQENQNRLSSATTLLQAFSQEMSFISNAATTAIKAVGEAQATIARK
jgi:hypothetical protein